MYQNYNNPNSYYQPLRSLSQNQQSQNQFQQMYIFLKGRPVSSLEEAKAAAIDFDGSIFFFPDLANKKIYTKQINIDGTSTLNLYEFKELPVDQPIDMNSYITRQEFNETLEKLDTSLTAINNFILASQQKSEESKNNINF